jgi:hypothetical protein
MANQYLEFSEVLPNLTSEEEAWLNEQLEIVHVFGDQQYTSAELPEGLDAMKSDWCGIRAWHDLEELPGLRTDVGFCYEFCDEDLDEDWGRHLWFYTEEWGYPELVAHLVQKFLKRFRAGDCWSLSYAVTCSKPRVGEFGGGAMFVTANEIQYFSDGDFREKSREAFEKTKQPDAGRLTEQRFVLYDFDMGDLASTRVYDDAHKAAQDGDLLDSVMVVGFTLECVSGGSVAGKEG